MALTVGTLNVILRAQTAAFTSGINRAEKQLGTFTASFGRLTRMTLGFLAGRGLIRLLDQVVQRLEEFGNPQLVQSIENARSSFRALATDLVNTLSPAFETAAKSFTNAADALRGLLAAMKGGSDQFIANFARMVAGIAGERKIFEQLGASEKEVAEEVGKIFEETRTAEERFLARMKRLKDLLQTGVLARILGSGPAAIELFERARKLAEAEFARARKKELGPEVKEPGPGEFREVRFSRVGTSRLTPTAAEMKKVHEELKKINRIVSTSMSQILSSGVPLTV